jgi:hypothetical protein
MPFWCTAALETLHIIARLLNIKAREIPMIFVPALLALCTNAIVNQTLDQQLYER